MPAELGCAPRKRPSSTRAKFERPGRSSRTTTTSGNATVGVDAHAPTRTPPSEKHAERPGQRDEDSARYFRASSHASTSSG
jgi:hypothetical protein